MSNETTNPVVKWILIGVIVVSFCVVGACVLFMTPPTKEHRAARELEKRGFEIEYRRQGFNIWQYPLCVYGESRNITEDDSQLLCQLLHLRLLQFNHCDLSGLNLDDVGNCRELTDFTCYDVTQFPVNEIRKLAACPIHELILSNVRLSDSDMEDFAKWTSVGFLILDDNAGITDVVFEHLEKIASLRHLCLTGTSVTKEGVEEFKKKRPLVDVVF